MGVGVFVGTLVGEGRGDGGTAVTRSRTVAVGVICTRAGWVLTAVAKDSDSERHPANKRSANPQQNSLRITAHSSSLLEKAQFRLPALWQQTHRQRIILLVNIPV